MKLSLLVPLIIFVSSPAFASAEHATGDTLSQSAVFDLLPDEGKVPLSEAFVPDSLLGTGVLRSAYTARYGPREILFIVEHDSAAQARRRADEYLHEVKQNIGLHGDGIYDAVDPVKGPVALLLHGPYLCGAIGERDREASHWHLQLLRARLIELERAPLRVNLPLKWKFITGDDIQYSLPGYDDHGWVRIPSGCWWETQGYDGYDGIAWYRTAVALPSTRVREASLGEALVVYLGKMDDNDIVYFNGVKVGQTTGAGLVRKYLVPGELVRWDTLNTIAVRIEDTGGAGGLGAGPYYVKPAGPSDLVRIHYVDEPAEVSASSGASITRNVRLEFRRPALLTGRLGIRVRNINNGSVVLDSLWRCTIGAGADTTFSYTLGTTASGSYRAETMFLSDSSSDTVRQSAVVAHNPLRRSEPTLKTPVAGARVADRATPVAFEGVVLDGYLGERIRVNLEKRLLRIDEAGVLAGYLQRPGNQEWVNEYVGKYLSAASQVWRYSRSAALKTQMDRIVDVLIACQKEDGYLGTYLPENYWLSWDVWGHKYNLIGLLGYYKATGFEPALAASRRIGDLLCRTFGNGPGQRNITQSGAWFGMASCSVLDPMVDLYALTGERKYLDFCRYIVAASDDTTGPRIISKLAAGVPVNGIAGGKAYEMLSNLLGLVKLYRIEGDARLLKAAETAWDSIARGRLYITGTASSKEIFQEAGVLPADVEASLGEGCVTTEWVHFNEELFKLTGDARYMDAIEKSVYNHLLAAENPLDGCVSYYTPLLGKRNFRSDIDGNCCLASVPRGVAVIPELAYTVDSKNGLSINLYSAGRVDCTIWTRKGNELPIHCEVETQYPENGKIRILLKPGKSARFTLALRVPSWSRSFTARVSGRTFQGKPGRYLAIDRTWEKTSTITVECDLTTRILDGGKSYSSFVAVQRGPQVLALDAGLNPHITSAEKLRLGGKRIQITPVTPMSTKEWFGRQFYSLKAMDDQGRPLDVVVVPFADAGQRRDEVRVWMSKE